MRSNPSRATAVLAILLALGVSACASSGTSSRAPGATSNRIVRAELDPLGQLSAYQAIERLRPRWLQSRAGASGSAPVLYVDGTRRTNLEDLRSIRIADVEQMEYMSGSDATTRFGTGHAGGAVMVDTRR